MLVHDKVIALVANPKSRVFLPHKDNRIGQREDGRCRGWFG